MASKKKKKKQFKEETIVYNPQDVKEKLDNEQKKETIGEEITEKVEVSKGKNDKKSLKENKIEKENLSKKAENVSNSSEKEKEKTKKSKNKKQKEEKNTSNENILKEEKNEKEEVVKEKNNKKIKNKENKQEKSSIKEKPENPNSEEYILYKQQKTKKILQIFVIIITLIMLISIFSTIFAFLNMSNTNIISGVSIKGIDVSNLSKADAEKKLEDIFEAQLKENVTSKYNDFEAIVNLEKIDAKYEITKLVDEAFLIGRSNNIVQNNYEILYVAIANKNIVPELKYKEKELDSIISEIALTIPGVVQEYTYHIEESNLLITKGKDGKTIDKEKFKEEIIKNINSRKVNLETGIATNEKVEIPVIDKKADPIDIEVIQKEIYKEPENAYYIEEPFQLFPEVQGVDLGISIEEAKKILEEDLEQYSIPVQYEMPEVTVQDLGREAFPYLISQATTKYDASNRNRSENLRIAASKVNGTVLLPGETFSYNQVVGERTVAAGYKNAAIYAGGGVVDGLAGGICQISSTLYNAVLEANLEIVERHNHSFKTSYLPTGKDATVVWGVKDFQFKNTRTYPIKIIASVDSGIASFEIYGIKEEVEYTVKITSKNTSTIPYKTQYVEDASLEPGAEKVVQVGTPGYRTTTYKTLLLNGAIISEEVITTDVYNAMTRIVHVGPTE